MRHDTAIVNDNNSSNRNFNMQHLTGTVTISDVKLKNFFQNRNSNPKNWLKLETCLLLYPSSMVKRVRISIFDFHSRFVDRRSEDRHTSKDRRIWRVHCARSDSDSCVAACQINWCIHNSTAHCEHLTATVTRAWCRNQTGGERMRGWSAVGQPT